MLAEPHQLTLEMGQQVLKLLPYILNWILFDTRIMQKYHLNLNLMF